MGLADFLAEASGDRGLGRALGGKSERRQRLEQFTQGELPGIADALEKATTRPEIEDATKKLSAAWYKAGLPIEGDAFDKFAERMTGSAIRKVQAADLESIRRDYGPKTTPITPQVAPEGQGQPLGLDTVFQPQTTPARPLDVEGAARYFEATGAKPQSFQEIFSTPAVIQAHEAEAKQHAASAAQTQQAIDEQQKVSNIPVPGPAGEAGLTAGAFMTPHSGPLATIFGNLYPQREPSGAALDLKRQGLEIQQQRLQVLADRVSSGQATAADRAELAQARLQLERDKLEQAKTTSTEAPVSGIQSAMDERVIARKAADRGTTDPASLKKIAAEMGYELEGTPTLNVPTEQKSKVLGFEVPGTVQRDKEGKPIIAPPTLTGDFTLKRRPKTVTKGAPAPQGQPAGGAPPAPRPGTIVRGYEFQGGDPADQKNWKKVAAR